MTSLRALYVSSLQLCCAQVLPDGVTDSGVCQGGNNVVSSSDHLLRSVTLRAVLAVYSVLGVAGGGVSLLLRVGVFQQRHDLTQHVLLTHLTVADVMMGLYVAIVSTSGRVYLGGYLWVDEVWRDSAVCALCGVLSVLAFLASSFFTFIITIHSLVSLFSETTSRSQQPRSTESAALTKTDPGHSRASHALTSCLAWRLCLCAWFVSLTVAAIWMWFPKRAASRAGSGARATETGESRESVEAAQGLSDQQASNQAGQPTAAPAAFIMPLSYSSRSISL
jgi:hypothetical protein